MTLGEISESLRRTTWPARLILTFFIVAAGVNLLAALAPVIGVDELIYRVAAADLYLRHERLLYLPSMWLHQQPQQVQMIQIYGMSLGSDATTQVVQWGMGLLVVAVLVDLGRREMPLAWALTGGAVFYSFSDVIVLSARASPDLASGLFMVLSLVAMFRWLETGSGRWLLLAGVLAGLFAAAVRLPGAYGAIGLAILVAIYGWRRFGWTPGSAVIRGMGIGLVAFAMVAPWYAKTYVQAGSPTWPFLMSVFGANDWTTEAFSYVSSIQQRAIGEWLSIGRVVTAPWDLTMEPARFNSGVMGPLMLATIPFLLLVRLPQRVRWMLAAIVVLAPIWYLAYPRLRALVPALGMLSIIAGYVMWRLWEARELRTWTRALTFGFVGLWLLFGLATAGRFHLESVFYTLGFDSKQEYLSKRLAQPDMDFHWYDDYLALNELLPSGSRLLIYDSRGYYLDFDYERYDLIAKREAQPRRLRDPQYVVEKVSELGSDYVLLWPEPQHGTAYEPSNQLEDTLHGLCGSRWEIVYRSESMIVCEVDRPASESMATSPRTG